VIGQAVERSLRRPLTQVQTLAYLRPRQPFRAQRSHTRSIDFNTPPSELLPLRPRVAQAGSNPLTDEVAFKLRHRRYDREQRLPERRCRVDVFLIRDELNAERTKLFKSEQQMLSAPGKAVKSPDQDAIEATLPRVIH